MTAVGVWIYLAKRILTCHQGTTASTFVDTFERMTKRQLVCIYDPPHVP